MPLSTEVERRLQHARLESVIRREHSWEFEFSTASLQVTQVWRLLEDGALTVTDREDGLTADRDAPIDAEAVAHSRLNNRGVLSATIDPETADLRISFEGGLRLDVLTVSTLHQAWELRSEGLEVSAAAGRLTDPAWFLKGAQTASDA